MIIGGFQTTTLLDYPGKVACTIFTAACNMRCPFCQNSDLITGSFETRYSEEEVLAYLSKRKGLLDGVCITGGEPTLQKDLAEAHKNNENGIVFLFVITFLSFILNASISTMTHFYLFKSHFIGLIKFLLKKLADKRKNAKKDIPLVDIKDDRKFSDDVQSLVVKEKEELLSDRQQFYITFGCYLYAIIMAVSFDKIIILDSFNGATVANYINLIAPSIFYLYFSKGKNYYGEKMIATFNLLFGVILILLFFVLSFY